MSTDAPAYEHMEYGYTNPEDLLHYRQPYPLAASYNHPSNPDSQDHWNVTSASSTDHVAIRPFAAPDQSSHQWTNDSVEDQQYWAYPTEWPTSSSTPQLAPVSFEPWPTPRPTLPVQSMRVPEMVHIPEAGEHIVLPQRGRGRAPVHQHSRSKHSNLGEANENALGELPAARMGRPRKVRNSQDGVIDNASSPRSGSSVAASSTRGRSVDRSKYPGRDRFTPVSDPPTGFDRLESPDREIQLGQRERPFPCQRCPARFSRKRDRDRHERSIHTGTTPYICAGCNEGFVRSDARGRHWRTAPQCQEIHKSLQTQAQDRSPSQ